MFKELHPNIRIRIYTSFLSRLVGSMIFPFMAIYFTKEMNSTIAGILLTINVGVQFIASLYGGYLADLLGRKRMMMIGEWMKAVAFLGMIMANSPLGTFPWPTYFMLTIIGISGGLINPAAEAMLIDVSTKESRSFMYSINYWAVNFSLMLGLIVGGFLFKTHFFELMLALFTMSIITLFMTSILIKETIKTGKRGLPKQSYGIIPIINSYKSVIKDLPFVWFTLSGITILSIEFQRNNYISIRLAEEIIPKTYSILGNLQLTVDGIRLLSLLTVINTLIIVLFTTFVAKIIRNKAEQPIMYLGFILFGLGYAFLAFSNYKIGLFIAVIILSIGELLYVPTRQAILADIIDDNRRGAYMAFNGFVFQIGKMIGSLGIIVGEVIGGIGMSTLTILLSLLGILFARITLQHKARITVIKQPSKAIQNSPH